MDEILSDLSEAALCYANRANLFDFFKLASRSSAARSAQVGGLLRWETDVPHPWFSGVLCDRAPGDDAAQLVEEIIAHFQAREFTWWLHPGCMDTGWADLLIQSGFELDDRPPGMALDLSRLEETETAVPLQIRPVDDLGSLRLWAEIFIAGYGVPKEGTEPYFRLLAGAGLDLPARHYLGYLDGQPMGASSLFLSAGVAGIYNVATLPPARGKGLGSHLTRIPLIGARRMGYQVGILQSSEMGYNLYRRLGFNKVCQIEHFVWAGNRCSQ